MIIQIIIINTRRNYFRTKRLDWIWKEKTEKKFTVEIDLFVAAHTLTRYLVW